MQYSAVARKVHIAAMVMFLALAVGCASTSSEGPMFIFKDASPDKAMIYVFRVPSNTASALSGAPMLLVGGEPVGLLKNGTFIRAEVESGTTQLQLYTTLLNKRLDTQLAELQADVKAGELYFFEYALKATGHKRYGDTEVAEMESVFTPVPADYAMRELTKTRRESL